MSAVIEAALDAELKSEIIEDELTEKAMAGAKHGRVGMRLGAKLVFHVDNNNLGGIYGPDTTFRVGSRNRMPDLAFDSAARIPPEGDPDGVWEIAPDLAIEIISPNDDYEEVFDKIIEYLEAGVRQVWVVSLKHQLVTVYYSLTSSRVFTANDELEAGDVAPGFRCLVSDLFAPSAQA